MRFAYTPLQIAILSILSTHLYAQSNETTNEAAAKLTTIVSQAEAEDTVGVVVYTKEDIENTPNSSKNITNFLKVNPNVQFGNNFRSGLQQGELNAADISINGGLAYDNKILVNGVSVNNTLNPVGADESNSTNQIMGNSQAASINTDLICNITVLDSNISAEYGEFTGGVVSAETCAPRTEVGEIHGNISYDYTSDSWSKINFPNKVEQQEYEDSTDESAQPYFTKQGISTNIYGKLSDTFGFNAFGSYRHSAIPLKTNFVESGEFDQKRTATNAGFEAFYDPNEFTSLKIGANFLENNGLYSKADILNSESTHASNSENFYINLKNKLDSVTLTQQLNYQTQQATRDTSQNTYTWRTSENKNWGTGLNSFEGNLGDINQEETRLEYSIKALFNPIISGDFKHQFKLGAGYGHYEAYWLRPEQTDAYATPMDLKGLGCLTNDGSTLDACDDSLTKDGKFKGQFLSAKTTYNAGQIDIRQDRWHAFVEDQIKWDKYLTATLGFRTDYDSVNKNNNVAPRTAFKINPFGTDIFNITTSWNRYYGLNSFVNELNDRIDQFEQKFSRTSATAGWTEKSKGKATFTYRSDLNTPYTDETLLGISSKFKNTALTLKWVNRDNKDQLRKTKMDLTDYSYTYDNRGKSESEIYSLSIGNIAPIQFANTQHRISLNADYTETTRNFDNYDSLDILTATPEIYYEGKIIDADDRPANEFNVPWTIRLNWDIALDNAPITINNFLSYQGKVDSLKRTAKGYTDAEGVKYDMFTPYTTKNKFYWDLKANYTLPTYKDTKTIFGLTINNVTNRSNTYINSAGDEKPEIGRQFIADVTFKF